MIGGGAPFRRIPLIHSSADGAEDPLEAADSPCRKAEELFRDKSCPGWFPFIVLDEDLDPADEELTTADEDLDPADEDLDPADERSA